MVSLEEVSAELAEGDVLEEVESDEDDDGESEGSPEEASDLRPMDALSLRTEELIAEMERRHLHPKGFLTDDAKELQKYFDKEYEEEVLKIRSEKRAERRREREKAQLHKKRLQLERQLREEDAAVSKDAQLQTWLRAIRGNETAETARIRCDSVTARALAKALWTNESLTALDLSRNKLSDFAGAQVARLLKRNRALVKLELKENKLGPRSCAAFADSLARNDGTLKFLDLESNPLTGDGFLCLAKSLAHSTCSLTALSIWRCDLGHAAGTELAAALKANETMISLDVGNNGFYTGDLSSLADSLDRNCELLAARLQAESAAQDKLEAEEKARAAVALEETKARDLEAWMDEQRDQRADTRIAAAEAKRQERDEAERQRLAEDQRLRDERRARELAAAAKKNRGKKGGAAKKNK